jgi:hypothetical protein
MAEKYSVAAMAAALLASRGLVSVAADRLGCSAETIRLYRKRHPSVEAACREARDAMTDIAELALYNKIRDGEGWAVCFYLKTQGKERGYVETVEQRHSGEILHRVYQVAPLPLENGNGQRALDGD